MAKTLGFTGDPKQQNNNHHHSAQKTEKIQEIKQDVALKQDNETPEEKDIYYDEVKKRWVLRGKIYDDDGCTNSTSNNNLQNTAQVKSAIVLPPKMNKPPKFTPTANNPQVTVAAENPKKEIQEHTNPAKKTVSDPFSIKQDKLVTLSTKQSKPNITSRYTSILDNK